MSKDRTSREAAVTGTKIINLMRGALDGLKVYTTEELEYDQNFWVPSPKLRDLLSGKSFSEIRDMLDDPENERYLDYDSHLIAYVMEEDMGLHEGYPTYLYVEDPIETHQRIMSRVSIDQEH